MATSACKDKEPVRSVSALRPDKTNPDRFICERAGTRPAIPPEYVIDWSKVAAASTVAEAVALAKAEQAQFVGLVRTREKVVAGYILKIEGVNFVCWNNMQWQRDFYAGLPQDAAETPQR